MFRLGVEESGGKVVRTSITHVPPSVMGMPNVMSAIAAERPDVVFAMYAGEEATDFARAYSSSPAVKDIPLVGSTFMTEGTEVSAMMPGLKSCSSWAPGVQGRTNESFKGAFREKMGYGPDVFAVLGYDTGRLILNAAQAAGGDLRSVRRVREALCAAMVMSPRGLLRMDHETHDMTTPLYLCEARARDLDVENLVVDPLTPPSGADHRTTALRGETRTGWLNAYLVA
jgi:branched-chain amino acid transport system substrate-binding protein